MAHNTTTKDAILAPAVIALFVLAATCQSGCAADQEPPGKQHIIDLLCQSKTITRATIQADWINEFLGSLAEKHSTLSQITIQNCRISGTLKLPSLNSPMDLTIQNSFIDGDIHMYGTSGYRILDFSHDYVSGQLLMNRSTVNRFIADESYFNDYVWISEMNFTEDVSFFWARFAHKDADFSKDFFTSTTNFSFVDLPSTTLRFFRCAFVKDAVFDHLNLREENPGTLRIGECYFLDSFYGQSMRLDGLALGRSWIADTKFCSGPNRFLDTVTIFNSTAHVADISDVVFSKYADLGGMRVDARLDLSNTDFEDDSTFDGTVFPQPKGAAWSGTHFDHTRFAKPPSIAWTQVFEDSPWWAPWQSGHVLITPDDSACWRMWEANFQHAGNIAAENESEFHRCLAEGSDPNLDSWSSFKNQVSRLFWGYGVRPLRVAGWMLLIYVLFTAFYFYVIRRASIDAKSNEKPWMARLRYSMDFSRRTSFIPLYGVSNSDTYLCRIMTLVHWFAFLALSVALLDSLSRVSPLFHSILGKLLTI